MYFTKIRLNGLTYIDLPIVGALPSDKYILKEASGLGPPEVDVTIAPTLNAGGIYQGRRPQSREIVLNIGLNPDYTAGQSVSDLRTTLYGMLTPGSGDYITIEIINDSTVLASAIGYVKNLEIVPFSKEPMVQLVLACPSQYFQAPADIYVQTPNKAFPEITNLGTAPAGFRMELTFTGSLSYWDLSNAAGQHMEIQYAFLANDKLTIDTRPGSRGIWVYRTSSKSIISGLTANSVWFMLHGGVNAFITSSQAFNWGNIFYRPQYWGI